MVHYVPTEENLSHRVELAALGQHQSQMERIGEVNGLVYIKFELNVPGR
jgi:hypothetical protein